MANWDPYATLGVGRSASEADIRQAYRKLAKELHPDVRPNDRQAEERFKRATAAFNLLSEPAKRARFDRGEIDADGNELAPNYGSGFGGGSARIDDLDDLLAGVFGGRGNRGGARSSPDLKLDLQVSVLEAAAGAKRRVVLADGRGLDVAVPAGVETGQVLRLKAQGPSGPFGPSDVLIKIIIAEDANWRRQGDDLYTDIFVPLRDAVLGRKVEVSAPGGPVSVNVPAGSSSGAVLRLRGKGVARAGRPGDLYARILIALPDPIDEDLRKILARQTKPQK